MSHTALGPGTIEWAGTLYRTILAPSDTGGVLSIVESITQPGYGPPRHVHRVEDETFVLLSGDCEFWLRGERHRRGLGETFFVPRGAEHTFRVTGSKPGRHLTILTPGGFEGFFVEIATRDLRIPQDMPAIAEAATRFHLAFTGPPLEIAE
ncbi:MAG: cupin domain-containing protein [Rhodobacteraceae bacterium]|nr:cupin domain-containing protein [Paracoccaceae bacterium]